MKGGLCCSGMFDLKPVRLSARSSYVAFTDEIEQALSSQRHLDKLNAPVVIAYGTLETPEFQRQSRDFAAAVKSALADAANAAAHPRPAAAPAAPAKPAASQTAAQPPAQFEKTIAFEKTVAIRPDMNSDSDLNAKK